MQEQPTPSSPPKAVRSDEFEELYANNVLFEPSIWDLKMVFGQLVQGEGGPIIRYHTAMTIPWSQAKLMCFFLLLQLVAHQSDIGGKISLPERMIPKPPQFTDEELEKNPSIRTVIDLFVKVRDEYFKAL